MKRYGERVVSPAAIAAGLLLLSLCWGRPVSAQLDTTIQLPTFGVSVDAKGVVEVKAFPDPDGRLRAQRLAAAEAGLPKDIRKPSPLRKVSLVRLEQAIARRVKEGKPLTEPMRFLAGLSQLQFLFCYPDRGDVIIAGPAEGWIHDAAGRVIGATTGRPTLRLDDLLIALRSFPPGQDNRPFIGCTIEPGEDGLKRFMEFQKTVPGRVRPTERSQVARNILEGTRQALGMSEIRVFGIPPTTHLAQVMVEADFRMKRIGIDLEPPPVKMKTFLGALRNPRDGTLQRWWFQPQYECLKTTDDQLAAELVGQGVQLLSEDLAIGPNGKQLNPTARVSQASRLYASTFTKKYPQIAAASPVFAQLRSGINLLVAAAFLQHEDWYARAGWKMTTLNRPEQLPVAVLPAPRQVACAVNVTWKGNRLLSPAGGVSLQPYRALDPMHRVKDDGTVRQTSDQVRTRHGDDDRWWWD